MLSVSKRILRDHFTSLNISYMPLDFDPRKKGLSVGIKTAQVIACGFFPFNPIPLCCYTCTNNMQYRKG